MAGGQGGGLDALGRGGVAGGQQPAAHRHQVRREDDRHGLAGGPAELLLDLWRVAVPANPIRGDALVGLHVQVGVGERAPGAGEAGLGVDHDAVRLKQAGGEQRGQREQGGGRVAPGHRHPPRPAQLLAVQLRQAVRPGAELSWAGMVDAVPGWVGSRVVEAEVGGEVDHQARGRAQPGGEPGRPAVREGREQHVGALGEPLVHGAEGEIAVGLGEAGVAGGHRLTGAGVPRRPAHPQVRVAGEQAEQLRTGVAGGAKHPGSDRTHTNEYPEKLKICNGNARFGRIFLAECIRSAKICSRAAGLPRLKTACRGPA